MEISNMDDTIDSRDIIERIKELEDTTDTDINTTEEQEELKALQALAEEGSNSSEGWEYGEILINEDYFTDYSEELCKELGEIPKDLPWFIANHIDWEGVAREIKMDYSEVDFDGVSYFIRN